MTFRLRHLVAALILHLLLFGLLAGGAQCSNKVVRPPPIQGVLLDASRKETAAEKRKEEAAKKKREEQAEKERREEEAESKKAEEQKKQKAADDLKAKQLVDAKKKKKAEEEKKKKETADKKKAEETNKKKKQQDEEKEKTLAAQRELQDKARLEDEMRQEALKRDADRETSARAASEKGRKQSEWAALLSRAVARKWTRPAAVTQDFSCTVHVLLLPDGTVSSATVAKSCGGGSALDRSVEDAVYRASPLPKPDDPSIFDRDLIINFIPGNQ